MAKRGRKSKPKLSLEEQIDEALGKYITNQELTLDETALLIWQKDGRPKSGPLSKARIKAIENSALAKLRLGLNKIGINSVNDVLDIKRQDEISIENFS